MNVRIDRRSRETRMRIGEALLRLGGMRAIDEIKVGDLAREAGFARSTFYAHFEGLGDFLARNFPRPDVPPGTLSQIIVAPKAHVVAGLERVLNARTGRISDIDWPLERDVRHVLARRHDFNPDDKDALSVWDTSLETLMFGRMIGTMRDFFWVVGLITLALGGLGVMNIMLVAVRERTREIGVRKALGATTITIQRQFFLEGFFLTMLSGGLGFGLAAGLCALVNQLPMPARFQGMVMTWQSGAMALGVLVLIGVVTSTYPARRASLLPPVEALRFDA